MTALKGLYPGVCYRVLRFCRDHRLDVEVFQNKNLQDLVEVLNGGAVQVLLVVIKSVPHRREGGGDEVEDMDA